MSRIVSETAIIAKGNWKGILNSLGIAVSGKHTPCPVCGGNDRFTFDDQNGRGTWFCRQCDGGENGTAGDGLDLVSRFFQCSGIEAAKKVREVLNLVEQDMNGEIPQHTPTTIERSQDMVKKVNALLRGLTVKKSKYLANKAFQNSAVPMTTDNKLLIPLVDINGEIKGAQFIHEDGTKRVIKGSHMAGNFIVIKPITMKSSQVIITEGYATGLSLSLFGDSAILAAVNAGNLTSVAKAIREEYPSIKIIIAGDNDVGESNQGKEKAEQAANAVNGWVTIPPTEHKADWDDYRQSNGIEATESEFNKGLYQVTPAKKKKETKPAKEKVKTCPYADIRYGGLYWVEPKTDSHTGEVTERESWLSDPVKVTGFGRDDNEDYLILEWQPAGSETKTIEAIPARDVGEREGWSKLKAGGMRVTAKSGLRAILADHLQRGRGNVMWSVVNATGWQSGAYIMPDGSVIGKPDIPVLFNGRSAAASGYKIKGDVKSWRDSVAFLAGGNSSMMLGIACAFAAPLIGLVDADGFGVHLFGGSSAGKTTTGNAATSVYGEPEALKLTWYSTALGLVNEAAAHNDGFMALDEIGQGSNRKAVADAAYALFNGVGKLQGAKEGGNRDLRRWRAIAFSTGEVDLESYIRADGGKVNAGQLVRLLNVPITKAIEYHGHTDGKAHADAMKAASNSNYGAVGRAWIEHLASQKKKALITFREAERRWIALLPDEASEQVRRVSSRFAVLEAALLLSEPFTGWSNQECRDALQHGFNAWVNEFGMGNRESKAWVEQAEAFLQRFGYSRYLPHPNTDPRDLPIKDLAGYRTKKNGSDMLVFHTYPSVFRDEIAIGVNANSFAQVLADAGMLEKTSRGITKKTLRIDGKQPYFVVLMMPDDQEE